MLEEIYQRILYRLDKVGLKAARASEMAGLSKDGIRNIQRSVDDGGGAGVNIKTVEALAPVLGTSVGWLLTGDDALLGKPSKEVFNAKEIGNRLKNHREGYNMSAQDFAKEYNFDPEQYENWENGVSVIPIGEAGILQNKFNLTLDYIFRGIVSADLQKTLNAASSNQRDK